MLEKIKKLLGKTYYPLNKVTISKNNLISNYRLLSKRAKIAPVLKSNAYGHGIVEVAKILDPLACPFFCVDSIFEAYQLLKAKIKTKILVMGYIDPENLKVKRLPFSYAVWDLKVAQTLSRYQTGCEIHIFVDTGMGREGVSVERLEDFLKDLQQYKNITIIGLMSHLASADNKKSLQNKLQMINFKKALQICQKLNLKLKYIHLDNSDGLINYKKGNLARVGLALYGIYSAEKKLKPVLEFKTTLVQIKEINKGEKVGYQGSFKAKQKMVMGILPVGYNDGVNRMLSNKGVVTISGIDCPIIGKVSMNVTAINLSNVSNPQVGQEVIIFSREKEALNSVDRSAKFCQTIPYDLLVHLTPTTRRQIV